MPSPRIFIDASVWIAAAGSPSGASKLVWAVCMENQAHPVTSRVVLREVERNVRAKLGSEALLRFYQDLASLNLDLVEAPSAEEIAFQSKIIAAKDAHVIASALKSGVGMLLTLDRKHFFTPKVVEANLPFSIMTPGDFLRRLAG
jgi:predicted nucleic acid-binding protein